MSRKCPSLHQGPVVPLVTGYGKSSGPGRRVGCPSTETPSTLRVGVEGHRIFRFRYVVPSCRVSGVSPVGSISTTIPSSVEGRGSGTGRDPELGPGL